MKIVIIGGGAVGCAIARTLSEYNAEIRVLEKEPDVAFGTSGRNSGVLHAGFNNRPGTLMARLCVEGSQGFAKEAEALGLAWKRTGKLVTALAAENLPGLEKLLAQGQANGVRGLQLLDRTQMEEIWTRAGGTASELGGIAALWSPETGVFDPFAYTTALAEDAWKRGVEFSFGYEAVDIRLNGGFNRMMGLPLLKVLARNAVSGYTDAFEADIIINAAGLQSDAICRMTGIEDYTIYPCRGEYHLLEKRGGKHLPMPIYPVPSAAAGGLGVHLTPSLHGNVMIGPSAEYLGDGPLGEWKEAEDGGAAAVRIAAGSGNDAATGAADVGTREAARSSAADGLRQRENYATTEPVMDRLFREGQALFPPIRRKDIIRSFSGVRPKLVSKEKGGYADFVIEESGRMPGFLYLTGIESPGLTASLPIGRYVAEMVVRAAAAIKPAEPMRRCGAGNRRRLEDSLNLLQDGRSSGSGALVCRCEQVSEATVLAAYDRILAIGGTPTFKGIKNRTRLGMGMCQGSFCTPDLLLLLQRERDLDPLTFHYAGFDTPMFIGHVR